MKPSPWGLTLSFGDMNAIAVEVAHDLKQPEFLRLFAQSWLMADEANTDIMMLAWMELIGKFGLEALINLKSVAGSIGRSSTQ